MVHRAAISRWILAAVKVGSIRGVPIALHWSFIPFFLLWIRLGRGVYQHTGWFALEIVLVFVIVLLHELGHVIAGQRAGLEAKSIVLWPLGGFALIADAKNWKSDLWMTLGGPLANLALVPILFVLLHTIGYHHPGDVKLILWRLGWGNLFMLLFNMLPMWPLDGGRVFRALLNPLVDRVQREIITALTGMICVIAVGYWFTGPRENMVATALLIVLFATNLYCLRWPTLIIQGENRHGLHPSARCPSCGKAPVRNMGFRCGGCSHLYCVFLHPGCTKCNAEAGEICCSRCGARRVAADWSPAVATSGA